MINMTVSAILLPHFQMPDVFQWGDRDVFQWGDSGCKTAMGRTLDTYIGCSCRTDCDHDTLNTDLMTPCVTYELVALASWTWIAIFNDTRQLD